jgi:hypothetical protein
LTLSVGEVMEAGAFPEALANIADAPLDMRLIFGMAHPRRIEQEPTGLAVFEKTTRGPWLQCIRPGDRRWEIIEHNPVGTPVKNRHAASRPSIVASSVCRVVNHTKQWRLNGSTTTSAQITCRLPVNGFSSMPMRP